MEELHSEQGPNPIAEQWANMEQELSSSESDNPVESPDNKEKNAEEIAKDNMNKLIEEAKGADGPNTMAMIQESIKRDESYKTLLETLEDQVLLRTQEDLKNSNIEPLLQQIMDKALDPKVISFAQKVKEDLEKVNDIYNSNEMSDEEVRERLSQIKKFGAE